MCMFRVNGRSDLGVLAGIYNESLWATFFFFFIFIPRILTQLTRIPLQIVFTSTVTTKRV